MTKGVLKLDKRLNAYRTDIADQRLKGQVEAGHFVDGVPMVVSAAAADLLREPQLDAGLDTQLLYGTRVSVFERGKDWSWVQADDDDYVGYVANTSLADVTHPATHRVGAARTFVYSLCDLKSQRIAERSMGALVSVTARETVRGTDYAVLADGGFMIANHLVPIREYSTDPVAIAEILLHTPYLWGGATAFGIDCSGLVSLAHRMCGTHVLRDTDMQQQTIGEKVETDADFSNLKRGDLVFWKGHVGMMQDARQLIHANGHTMTVASEPLMQAVERIGYLYNQPTMVRRP